MDELLAASDELHIEILSLLEGTQFGSEVRNETALVAFSLAMEHALSLRLLVRTECFGSALAMMRLQYEAITRGVWLLYAASDPQVKILSSALTIESEKAANQMPSVSVMLKQAIDKAPPQALRMLVGFKDSNWSALNSFVHGGIHALNRHAEGYPVVLIDAAVRNSNGLNIMVLQLGIFVAGDPRFVGVVRALQEKFQIVLPELISVPN